MEFLIPEEGEVVVTFNTQELNEFLPEIIAGLKRVGFKVKDFTTDTMLRIRQYVFERVEDKELGEAGLIKRLEKELEGCRQQVNLLERYIATTSQVKGGQ